MAKGYIFDKLMNRKIEGDSSFVSQESFDESIGEINEDIGGIEEDIGGIEEDIGGLGEDIGDIKQVLETVENFNISLSTSLPEGVTESDTAYRKCVYIPSSKILWIIIETRITNSNESQVSLPTIAFDATVTDAIGAKVFKIDGISIKDYDASSGQSTQITKACGVFGRYDGTPTSFTVSCYSKNNINIYCSVGNLAASSTNQVGIRVPILIV